MAFDVEAAELLDVQVDHLAGREALVADHHRLRIEVRQLAQAKPAQHRAHRRAGHAQRLRDLGTAHPLPPPPG
ncbi:hypothetical protein [Phenylobacterium sp.]|uniref:hypothetical protein n=1 Tax=Phenylobacterium sp. TaxID=1871053 RepID=UPI003BAA9623